MADDSGGGGDRRPRLKPTEENILERMLRVDRKGQGCWQSVESIGAAFNEREKTLSRSQTRVYLARLRAKGYILPAGATDTGTIVYLFPEKRYDSKDLPLNAKRSARLPWEAGPALAVIDKGPALVREGAREHRGIKVGERVTRAYAEPVWKAAIDSLIKSYGPELVGVKAPIAMILAVCKRLAEEARQEKALREQRTVELLKRRLHAVPDEPPPADPALDERRNELEIAASLGINPAEATRRMLLGERFVAPDAPLKDAQASASIERSAGLRDPAVPPGVAPPVKQNGIPDAARVAAPVTPSKPSRGAPITVSDAVACLIRVRNLDTAAATRRFYGEKGRAIVALIGDRPLVGFGHDDVLEYFALRRDQATVRPIGLATLRKEAAVLKASLVMARRRGAQIPDPGDYWPKIRFKNNTGKRYLTHDEFNRLYKQLRPHQRDWLVWFVYSGGRLGELIRLQWSHLDVAGRRVHLPGTKTEESDRVIPMHARLVKWCETRGRGKGAVLQPWTNIQRDLKLACEASGMPPVSPNDLRRTFCTWMRQNGADAQVVARLMGHVDTTMVDRVYSQMDAEQYRQAIDKL